MEAYLEALNEEQRAAVFHPGDEGETMGGRPLLILAGAGSGKTRVITTKIAYLIRERGVEPWTILAVTFTNKAAREMAERARGIDERAGDAMMRTFHSFGAWFLRRYGDRGGLAPGFVIYDDDDAVTLLGTIMEGAPMAEVKLMAHRIARAKDYFLSPEDPELDLIDSRKNFRRIYAAYEERLGQIGNVDFGDLIKKPVEILRRDDELAARLRRRFRVILVDEYQDANVAQAELLKALCGPETYLCVVGDDDQSIYRFRGAEVRNILEFPEHFPGADIVRLERNYRSTAAILRAAASVVDHNTGRLGKELRAARGEGVTPALIFLPNQDEEAAYCARLIIQEVRKGRQAAGHSAGQAAGQEARGGRYADWAVLYRTNAQSLSFETEFLRRRIPYRVVGSLKFYEREEIKDALALLSFLVNPRDEVAFRRVVNKPSRGVGPAAVGRVVEEAGGGDLAAAARRIEGLSAKARAGLGVFLGAIDAGRAALDEAETPAAPGSGDADGFEPEDLPGIADTPEAKDPGGTPGRKRKRPLKTREGLQAAEGLSFCVVTLAAQAGLAEYHLTHDEIAGNQRLSNLQELANAASLYPASLGGLLEFLEHIELDRSLEEKSAASGEDLVTLITLHNTKGLEFRRVIMTGVEGGVFPRTDKTGEDLEEERRLFYVGATRAMDELYFTSCATRRVFGQTRPMEPSLFLRELDRANLMIVGRAPYGFAPPGRSGVDAGAAGPEGTRRGRGPGAGSGAGKKSSDGRWQVGDRLFHDDRGYGAVVEIRETDDGPVIRALFESGGEARFLSLYQSGGYTRIGEE